MEKKVEMVSHRITQDAGIIFTGLNGNKTIIVPSSGQPQCEAPGWFKTGAQLTVDVSTVTQLQAMVDNCAEIKRLEEANHAILEKIRKDLGMPFPRVYGQEITVSGRGSHEPLNAIPGLNPGVLE